MSINSVKQLKTVKKNVRKHVDAALEATGGLLRLAPAWVPRSFLQPGLRLKLHPDDTYAYGLNRGGIDERWFGSTTEAANEGRVPDEGLSYVVHGRNRLTLRDAVAENLFQSNLNTFLLDFQTTIQKLPYHISEIPLQSL